ncbi:regulator [Helicobacter sp. CLO-3]|uniref:response regulator n=1 Tax=unclassified Helicobacter TaxID=2593540 RepID=UPI00080577D2|nr:MULTISPECIES: response regulator [unclassified Helicobacter]OBV29685.1 regulator [Helicobacter sp. CLO-3]OHU84864.1 regulator [Helicobacter sp. CLO-3]
MQEYPELKPLSILYVEDNDDVARVTAMVLEDYMDRILVAKNGIEALDLFDTHNVDIVLTDILMPKMSGIDLCRKIREGRHNTQCPIVIATAHTEVQYLLDAIGLGVDGYILKPIDIQELLATLRKAILPRIQAKKIKNNDLLLSAISTFVGGKKIEIIKFLFEHCDEENMFYGSYEDIIAELNVSKPTIVKTFHQLMEVGLLVKIRNKVYKINTPNV